MMKSLLGKLWRDECGFIVSAELALITTTGVLATVVGLHAVAGAVNSELNDVSNAIGALDQSYSYNGYCHIGHSWVAGSAYLDTQDDCDCTVIRETTPHPKFDGSEQDHRDIRHREERHHRGKHNRRGERHHPGEGHHGDRHHGNKKGRKGDHHKGSAKKHNDRNRKGDHRDDHHGRKWENKEKPHGRHPHGNRYHPGRKHRGEGHHGFRQREGSAHGRTIILKAENGRPIYLHEPPAYFYGQGHHPFRSGCQIHPPCQIHSRCQSPCHECQRATKKRKPTLLKPVPGKRHQHKHKKHKSK